MNRSLKSIQADFQTYVLGAASRQPTILPEIAQQHGLQAIDRLAIYYDAYRIRLREALSEAFGKTHAYLGDDMFAELTAGYIQAHPSHYRNLRWYGGGFAYYLMQALPDHPIVAELAAFEWTLGLTFDAADAPLISADDIRSLGVDEWNQIGFHLQPSLQFLPMRWNTTAIWLALDQEQTPPDAVKSEKTVQWLVWRKDLQPHFRSLGQLEAQALQGLRHGLSFSAICAAASADSDAQDSTQQIAGWLQIWLGEGVLAEINYDAEQELFAKS